MRSHLIVVMAATLILLLPQVAAGDELSAEQIINKQLSMHAVDQEKETLILELVKKSGATKERRLERFSAQDAKGLQRMLAVITEPEDVRGTGVLIVEKQGGGVDQWLYMPALEKIKQVRADDRNNKFMGTDFCYGDLRVEDPTQNTYTLLEAEAIGGEDCHVIEALPATEEEAKHSGYSRRVFWVSKAQLFTLKVEFYDSKGRLKKVLRNNKLTKVSETAWRADEMTMETVKNQHRSVMRVVSRSVEQTPDEALFTVEGLRSFAK